MARLEQKSFLFREEITRIERKRRPLQPRKRLDFIFPLTSADLLHPLDINHKNRLGRWVAQAEKEFPLEEVLTFKMAQLVHLYLLPQPPDNRWHYSD